MDSGGYPQLARHTATTEVQECEHGLTVIPKADLEMSYAEVKALAKSKGINPFGKSKVALLTELGEHNEQEED